MTVEINIYLHGFFFSEIQGDRLIIASPKHCCHHFGYWDHQQNELLPFPAPGSSFPWTGALQQGQHDTFPDDVLQFDRGYLGMAEGEFFITPPGDKYAVYLSLPVPFDITSVRDGGNMDEIVMNEKASKVAQSIYKHCKEHSPLSLITRLTYRASGNIGFTNISFYAEHCSAPSPGELKMLFDDAKSVFPKFDLTFDRLNPGKNLSRWATENDMTLAEAGSRLQNNPCCSHADRSKPSQESGVVTVRTANCPQFGITQG